MSINLCNDLPLMMLVPRHRIASVTSLAHPAAAALLPGADAGIAVNHGTAEEILLQRPDMVLASAWTPPLVRRAAAAVGARIVEVEPAESFPAIRRALRRIGAAVAEPTRAEALVRRMDADLARLAEAPPARRPRVVAWDGAGAVPGRGTLTDAIIAAAGARNVAAEARGGRYMDFGLEDLIVARPDAILLDADGYDQPSLHRRSARHPLLARLFAGREIAYGGAAYMCGLPQSASAATALRGALDRLPR